MALAIELAARRVEAYGLQQTAALLDQRLTLLWLGPRTAPPRQKTLQATLDWSYGLLSDLERVVLRRLAVFVGHFTLDAALAVVTGATVDQAHVFGAIDSLVAKSMVATRPIGAMMRYRLLDTTRAYALEIDDRRRRARRPRRAPRDLLSAMAGADRNRMVDVVDRDGTGAPLSPASTMCARPWNGASAPTATSRSASGSPPPRRRFSWRCRCCPNVIAGRSGHFSLSTMPLAAAAEEMHLQAALGVSLMFTRGNSEAARAALNRSLAIAEERGDAPNQLQLLGLLHMFHHRIGDFKATLHYAKRSSAVSEIIADSGRCRIRPFPLGSSLHHSGDIAGARAELEAALALGRATRSTRTIYLGFEHYNYGRHRARANPVAAGLSGPGHGTRAPDRRGCRIEEPSGAAVAGFGLGDLGVSLGRRSRERRRPHRLPDRARRIPLARPLSRRRPGYKAALSIRRGDARSGVERLQGAMDALHATRYELLTTTFNIWLAQGLGGDGSAGRRPRPDRPRQSGWSRTTAISRRCRNYCA